MSKEKIAAQVPAIVAEARDHLTKMAGQMAHMKDKTASLEKELRVHKLAQRFVERHLDDELTFQEKVAKLSSIPSQKLDVLEASLDMLPGGHKLGSLEETSDGDGEGQGNGAADLDAWIVSGQAYN